MKAKRIEMQVSGRHSRHCRKISTFSTLCTKFHSPSPEISTLYGPRMFGTCRALLKWQKHMFRISTIDTQGERRLVVEGTLVQPWVTELRRTWSNAGDSLDGRKLVIDLTNATMIDVEGKAAILDLMKEGAKFCCGDVLTKHVLKQLAHKCHTRLRNVLNRPDSNGGRCWEREKK